MNPRDPVRFPLVDLSIILAICLIGWGAYRLATLEPQISSDRQQSKELMDVFREGQELFKEMKTNPELERRQFDLEWYDALLLKAEYLGIADRLDLDLPELTLALDDSSTQKGRPDLPAKLREMKGWIEKQKDAAGFRQLEFRSKELKERIARAQPSPTNSPVAIIEDLGTLLKEIDRAYDGYLADLREVTNNAGKPLVLTFTAQRRDRARKTVAQLTDFAQQARRDAQVIELFLETQSASDAVQRTRRQTEIIQAFVESRSPAEFSRRIRREAGTDNSSSTVPLLRPVRQGLLAALAALGVFLILDLYWRMVVMPLRTKLVERDTTIAHQQKLAHFEQLAAGLAHEIRNPLTAVNARLYTVQRKLQEGTPEHQDAVVIGNEIDRVNQILKDFIQLTRPFPPRLARMTAGPLLNEIRDLMAPQLQRQAIRLVCQTQSQASFRGDQQQLKQVLINLIQNAADSIGQDGTVILRARDGVVPLKGAQTGVVLLEVEDNGSGIHPEVRQRLFDPFFSTKKGGTGLGLPISARIIDRHGGTLDFETQVSRGTVFRIALPVAGKEELTGTNSGI